MNELTAKALIDELSKVPEDTIIKINQGLSGYDDECEYNFYNKEDKIYVLG